MNDPVRQLQEDLSDARFHNRVLTWIAAALLFALLLALGWR